VGIKRGDPVHEIAGMLAMLVHVAQQFSVARTGVLGMGCCTGGRQKCNKGTSRSVVVVSLAEVVPGPIKEVCK
jgi:hypothetical protein